MTRGKTFIVSGPSGVGKSTVLKALMEKRKNLYFSISATTREARPGEIDGVHYHFISVDDFRDWISRDEAVVAAYAADPKCTFVFTVSAFRELFWLLRQVSRPGWYEKLPRRLPVRLFSGDADPVGGYGRGVARVYEGLRRTGHRDLKMKLYPGGRHEMLNERGKEQVYADVLNWCEEILRRLPQPPAEKDQRGNKKQDAHRDT